MGLLQSCFRQAVACSRVYAAFACCLLSIIPQNTHLHHLQHQSLAVLWVELAGHWRRHCCRPLHPLLLLLALPLLRRFQVRPMPALLLWLLRLLLLLLLFQLHPVWQGKQGMPACSPIWTHSVSVCGQTEHTGTKGARNTADTGGCTQTSTDTTVPCLHVRQHRQHTRFSAPFPSAQGLGLLLWLRLLLPLLIGLHWRGLPSAARASATFPAALSVSAAAWVSVSAAVSVPAASVGRPAIPVSAEATFVRAAGTPPPVAHPAFVQCPVLEMSTLMLITASLSLEVTPRAGLFELRAHGTDS